MKNTRKGTRKETPTQGEGAIRKPGAGERPKTDSGPYKKKKYEQMQNTIGLV